MWVDFALRFQTPSVCLNSCFSLETRTLLPPLKARSISKRSISCASFYWHAQSVQLSWGMAYKGKSVWLHLWALREWTSRVIQHQPRHGCREMGPKQNRYIPKTQNLVNHQSFTIKMPYFAHRWTNAKPLLWRNSRQIYNHRYVP